MVLVCLHQLRMAGYVQPKKCLSAVKTGFGRNGRQTKNQSRSRSFDLPFGLIFIFASCRNSGWLINSSKLVVNQNYSMFYRGISRLFGANSGSPMADEQNFCHSVSSFFVSLRGCIAAVVIFSILYHALRHIATKASPGGSCQKSLIFDWWGSAFLQILQCNRSQKGPPSSAPAGHLPPGEGFFVPSARVTPLK